MIASKAQAIEQASAYFAAADAEATFRVVASDRGITAQKAGDTTPNPVSRDQAAAQVAGFLAGCADAVRLGFWTDPASLSIGVIQ